MKPQPSLARQDQLGFCMTLKGGCLPAETSPLEVKSTKLIKGAPTGRNWCVSILVVYTLAKDGRDDEVKDDRNDEAELSSIFCITWESILTACAASGRWSGSACQHDSIKAFRSCGHLESSAGRIPCRNTWRGDIFK